MSILRADSIRDKAGTGAPDFPNGITVTGIVTSTVLNPVVSGTLTGSTASFSGNLSGSTASFSGNVSVGGTLTYQDVTNIDSVGLVTARSGVRVNAGGIVVDAGGVAVTAGISTFKGANFNGGGLIKEKGNIDTTARNGVQAVDLASGMVHNFTSQSAGNWTPNFRVDGSNSLDGAMDTGDTIAVTMIVAKGNTHYSSAIQIDGSAVTPEWSGGAPSSGGAAGTFDVYSYTIIKTGSAAFSAFAAVNTYE